MIYVNFNGKTSLASIFDFAQYHMEINFLKNSVTSLFKRIKIFHYSVTLKYKLHFKRLLRKNKFVILKQSSSHSLLLIKLYRVFALFKYQL